MAIAYIPPKNNKAKNIKIDDVDNNFQSNDVEGALKELAKNSGGSDNNVDLSEYATKIDLNSKVDKVEGKGLSTVDFTTEKDAKLNGIEQNANNYVHPKKHSATLITQDETHRFVSDSEKSKWDGFESQLGQIETKNVEQDDRLDKIEYTNKRQDVLINGLFNENADGRLSITGEGNSVKLEGSKDGVIEVKRVVGNTLVNLCDSTLFRWIQHGAGTVEGDYIKIDSIEGGVIGANAVVSLLPKFTKSTTTYTLIFKEVPKDNCKVLIRDSTNGVNLTGTVVLKNNAVAFTTKEKPTNDIYIYYSELAIGEKAKYTNDNFILLEGDYTNKPIPQEYFEGMKSTFEDKLVTQEMVNSGEELAENLGKYKCDVKVVGKNLFDGILKVRPITGSYNVKNPTVVNNIINLKGSSNNTDNLISYNNGYVSIYFKNPMKVGSYYSISMQIDIISNQLNTKEFYFLIDGKGENAGIARLDPTTGRYGGTYLYKVKNNNSNGSNFVEVRVCGCEVNISNIQVEEVSTTTSSATDYEPYQEYKTSILLDEPLYMNNELCVHEGKLGYWKKREKVVLDGSENWTILSLNADTELSNNYIAYSIALSGAVPTVSNSNNAICDKFAWSGNATVNIAGQYFDAFSIHTNGNLYFKVKKSVASTVSAFKQWLQANPTTVVYELAEPIFVPILENTPKWILDSYNSCTVQFETNVPILSSSFTYTGNVPSVIAMNNNLKNVNNEQLMQNEIDNTTMLAVADVYEMLMPVAAMSLNTREGGNKMVELYVVLIMRGLKTIEQVPSTIRPQVEEMLKQVQ